MNANHHVLALCVGALALSPTLATAQDAAASGSVSLGPPADSPDSEEESDYVYERGGLTGVGFTAALKAGLGFSQAFSELGSSPLAELEIGYLLPLLDRSFEIFAAGQYAQPKTSGSNLTDTYGPDGGSRLPGPMSYELTQQQAIITAGLRYRIPLDSPMFRPYIGAGARAYLMKTKIDGKAAAEAFGANEETVTKYGPFGSAGGELYIGPGALLLEIQVGWAKIDGFVLRDTNAGAVNSLIGYRLFI